MGGGHDIFSQFFGGGMGGMGGQKSNKPKKGKPVLKELKVSLEDVYKGKMMKLSINRKRVCAACDGLGGKNVKTCTHCKGRGMVEKMVMLGPGMYQHATQPCKECKGEGKIMDPKDKCKVCNGMKVKDESK